jgi:transcriptional regulator with XRE-family HTH domain
MKIDLKPLLRTIRRKREEKGLTQEYMAKKLSTSQNVYSKLELGQTKLTVERLTIICEILNLELKELLNNIELD